ncbi:MAG: hypothetical protein KDE27_16610, partial [Planctomycetes bacterium]|nr:hypothetical protein [Planctomycetota bacterium]
MRSVAAAFVPVVVLCAGLAAQRGDRANDPQTMLPADVAVPPATPRSPAEELATFVLAEGFRAELVASEPLIHDPVVAEFDAAGRLWVCEWPSYMVDLQASGENAPTGRVAVLHDDDGDGVMDRSTTFLGDLVLPRAVLPMAGGALVIEPPSLWWCPDADGDLVADGKQALCDGFQAGIDNPEHSGNGLRWGLDHRIHISNDKRLLRWLGPGEFAFEDGSGGGQWGITFDDRGRYYFNYNSDWLRCDLVPGHHGPAAAAFGGLPGLNHRVVDNQSTWPIRMTPGINRGYQKGMLRDDYTLRRNTAVCSPYVYRGSALASAGRSCDGDIFVCEPAGNLVRRFVPTDTDGLLAAANPYEGERKEFLASTDERFRPVHLFGGQDGGLYLVDMYRGLIQHRNYVTSFLADQVVKRGLEQPIGRGRIWRVVASDRPAGRVQVPQIAGAEVPLLVAALASADGTTRDLALRELVQRRDLSAATLLRGALAAHERAACRIVLLSALAGLDTLEANDVLRGLRDADAGVVCMALQHSLPSLLAGNGLVWAMCEHHAKAGGTPNVAWHAALAFGEVLAKRSAARRHDRALDGLAALLAGTGDPMARTLAAMSCGGRQVDLLRRVADAATADAENRAAALRELARIAMRTRDAARQSEVFAFAAELPDAALQGAVLQGALDALPQKERQRAGWLKFEATPSALLAIVRADDPTTRPLATALLSAVALEPA